MKGFALKLIKEALSDSPKTRLELLKITKLPERTLRYNLSKLKEDGLIEERFMIRDLRKKLFLLKVSENEF
ncbi:MAG: hypothetical protein DRP00_01520 [Candidatus Aenigmatarchaeota archaeon]|nr:MAG: hypothetical protein DRP00_01520 [Candidatus Aenigmarchaeota archaeon]